MKAPVKTLAEQVKDLEERAEALKDALYEIACGNKIWEREQMIEYAAETLKAYAPERWKAS